MIQNKVKILDCTKDKSQWKNILSRFNQDILDIYYTPEYVNLYVDDYTLGLLFTFEDSCQSWIMPILKKRILFDLDKKKKLFDTRSPYGFGGPLSTSDDRKFIERANFAFDKWCLKENILTCLTKFNPIIQNEKWFIGKKEKFLDRATLSIDLKNINTTQNFFSSKINNLIRKVKKNGIEICQVSLVQNLEKFIKIYLDSMNNKKVSKFYHFNDRYFKELAKITDRDGWFIAAKLNENIIAGSIFLNYKRRSIYHLSATQGFNKYPGVSNAIIHKATELAIKNLYLSINLGGGNSAKLDDSLYLFKKKMSNNKNNFYIDEKIIDLVAYNSIVKKWKNKFPKIVYKYKNYLQSYNFSE